METLVSFINKNHKDLDFVLFGGDNFNNNVPGDKDARTFKKIIDKLHCPTYLVRGNKESSPKPENDTLNLADFEKYFFDKPELTVAGKDWRLEKNGYLILGLDSNIEHQNNGRYTKETLDFAQKALDEGKPTIILNHHPYTNYWGEKDPQKIHKYVLNNTQEVQKRLFGYKNLILTLSGHKHVDYVGEIQGTKVIATRGFVRPLDIDQYPMRLVEINGNRIDEKLIYTS
jgi:Icc protein